VSITFLPVRRRLPFPRGARHRFAACPFREVPGTVLLKLGADKTEAEVAVAGVRVVVVPERGTQERSRKGPAPAA